MELLAFHRYMGQGVGKLAALDVGTKHVGLAITDETKRFVVGSDTLKRKGSDATQHRLADASVQAFTKQLQNVIDKEKIVGLVVGIPLHNGVSTPFCKEIVDLMLRIQCTLPQSTSLLSNIENIPSPMPFTLWDEQYSTMEGRRLVAQTTSKRSVYLKRKDSMAASVIMQKFLMYKENVYDRE